MPTAAAHDAVGAMCAPVCVRGASIMTGGSNARDRLAAVALGTACIAFAVAVFIFFTTWLLAPVLSPSVQALFPPRFWLHALPTAGVVFLTVGITAFIGIQRRSARS